MGAGRSQASAETRVTDGLVLASVGSKITLDHGSQRGAASE